MTMSEAGKLGFLKSRATQQAKKEKRIQDYLLNPTTCNYCEKAMDYESRNKSFCNRSCAASFNNCGKTKNYIDGKYAIKNCLNCETETVNLTYCSKECFHDFQWKLDKSEIESTGKCESKHLAKKYLSDVYGYKCKICGISEWCNQKLVLVLDHMNGNSEDCDLKNLRLICPNCDSQTSTFKGRNLGNGRHIRRQRYLEGKSF